MKNINLTFGLVIMISLFTCTLLKAQQYPGYTLYSVQNGTATQLIDTASAVYHSWTHTTANKTGYSSYLMPGGILWRSIALSGTSLTGGGMTGKIQKIDYTGALLWDYTYSSTTYCLHHDFCPLPNGNVLVISYDVKTPAQVTTAGCSSSLTVWSEKIMEIQPTGATTGTVVWQWNLWDHLVQNVNSSAANYQTSIVNHPELMNVNYGIQKDWFHMNGIDYNPVLDQIALSSHNINMWMIIDHSTTTAEAATHAGGLSGKGGDFLYRYGNPASYGATGSTVLNVTHDAHWIPEGSPNAGRLVGFNNKGVSSTQSAVDQIDLPVSGYNYTIVLGSAYSPSAFTQRHACSGYSSNMGSSEQLPNGNMLVCMATLGTMYEVSSAGTTLWSKTATGNVPQAHHYTDCFINNAAPAKPTISESTGTLTSSSATTYQWYMNGVQIPGAASQSYTPSASGIYLVRITDVNGCVYSYSSSYVFTMTATGINENLLENAFVIFPNPSNGLINIDNSALNGETYSVTVFDATGKVILKEECASRLDFSSADNGIYFINIVSPSIGTINKKVIIQK
jgi:arylsulfotransferase ASST/type IX secretion system substrate protein